MTANKKALIAVSLIVIIGGIFFVVSKDKPKTNSSSQPLSNYSAKEVSDHKTKNNCWTIINNSVYDVTSYVQNHPGGDNILSACGVDSTDYFNGDKKGQLGDSNDHSNASQALSQLSRLKIGELVN
jgi:cytochrome b involved in lipid metabolism